ncbi:hypothetical protein DFH29DRAFT_992564 [Suillus ampliporus]|nr:hypothetical protein DFH29DRAFT_992564 [Suillus ampliporus]
MELCPNCNLGDFPSIEALILHLNSESTSCWPSKARPKELPVPPVFRRHGSDQMAATGTCHPQSGYVFGIGKNMLDRLEDDPYAYWWKINHYYPFHDKGEWELGKFLVENLTQTQMIKFLKLKWVNDWFKLNLRLSSFLHSLTLVKDQLLDWMDSLPCFTEWKVSNIEFSGYTTIHPIELVWCDALEVVKQLFSDPIFANHMTYTPHAVNVGNQREYRDYMSADMAWKIQDYLPFGATQVPIILGSDKTHVTQITGGLEMHLVFITIGNIDSEFHMHSDYQSILQARLWHKCMDLILANLKATAFQKVAKTVNLSGVHMPFWHDWHFACLSIFLTGDVLHTCFKFFTDHPLKWVKEAIGAYELDTRFIVQHKQVGTCHFTKGITHVKQMTGREYRDIQRTIVASIAVHSPKSLQSMEQALLDFHTFKGAIVEAEVRKGKKGVKEDFFIPKLKLLQSFRGTVQQLGTLMQFSADTTECLLITHCKDLFLWTAHQSKDFMEQCMQILNRQESMEIFDLYALLTSRGVSLVNAMHAEEEEVATTNPALSWVSRVLPDEVNLVRGPRPVRNHFLKGILSGDALVAFQLNVTPDYKALSPADIRTKYTLPGFDCALANFIGRSSLSSGEHTHWDPNYGRYQTWNKFRLQLHSAFQQWVIMPSRVVQAYPPSDDFPLGNCDTVLIDGMGVGGKTTSYVAQVRLIFQPTIRRGSKVELPSYLSNPLLYVQYFRFVSSPDERPELMMWTVERAYTQDENGNRHREGAVVQVTDVMHAVELIPVYGEAVGDGVSSATSLETYECSFLNSFADKESYHTFSTEFV